VRAHRETCDLCPAKARKPTEEEVRRRAGTNEVHKRVPVVPYVVPVTEEGPPPWGVAHLHEASDPPPNALVLFLQQRTAYALSWLQQVHGQRRDRNRVLAIVRSTLRVEWGVEVEVASLRKAARLARTERVRPWPAASRTIVLSPLYEVTWKHLLLLTVQLNQILTDVLSWVDTTLGGDWASRLLIYAATEVVMGIAPHTPVWWGLVASAGGFFPLGYVPGARRMVLIDAAVDT